MSSARVAPSASVEIPIAAMVLDGNVDGNVINVGDNVAIIIDTQSVAVIENQLYSLKKYVCCCSESLHLGLTVATACGYIMAMVNYAVQEGVQDGTTTLLAIVGIVHVSGMVWLKCKCTYDARVPFSGGGGDDKVYDVKFSFYKLDENSESHEEKIQVILFDINKQVFTVKKEEETLEQIKKNAAYNPVGDKLDNIEKFKESIENKTFSATLSNGNIIVKKKPTSGGGKRRRRRSLQKNKRKRNIKTRRKYNKTI